LAPRPLPWVNQKGFPKPPKPFPFLSKSKKGFLPKGDPGRKPLAPFFLGPANPGARQKPINRAAPAPANLIPSGPFGPPKNLRAGHKELKGRPMFPWPRTPKVAGFRNKPSGPKGNGPRDYPGKAFHLAEAGERIPFSSIEVSSASR